MDFTKKWRAGNTVYLRCDGIFPLNEVTADGDWLKMLTRHSDGKLKHIMFWHKSGVFIPGSESPFDIIDIKSERLPKPKERMLKIMWGSDRENEA